MSSDSNPIAIGNTDIGIIRNVLRYTGFQYQEPICELDRNAARYALELYQNGTKEPGVLIAAVSAWAERLSKGRDHTTPMEVGV